MAKRLKAKKHFMLLLFSSLILVFVLLINLVSVHAWMPPFPPQLPDLGCDDLSRCSSPADCNEAGTPVGCLIVCDSGATIHCPLKSDT